MFEDGVVDGGGEWGELLEVEGDAEFGEGSVEGVEEGIGLDVDDGGAFAELEEEFLEGGEEGVAEFLKFGAGFLDAGAEEVAGVPVAGGEEEGDRSGDVEVVKDEGRGQDVEAEFA